MKGLRRGPERKLSSTSEKPEEQTDDQTEHRDGNDEHCKDLVTHDGSEDASGGREEVRNERGHEGKYRSNSSSSDSAILLSQDLRYFMDAGGGFEPPGPWHRTTGKSNRPGLPDLIPQDNCRIKKERCQPF